MGPCRLDVRRFRNGILVRILRVNMWHTLTVPVRRTERLSLDVKRTRVTVMKNRGRGWVDKYRAKHRRAVRTVRVISVLCRRVHTWHIPTVPAVQTVQLNRDVQQITKIVSKP